MSSLCVKIWNRSVSVLNDSEYTGDEYAQLYKKVIEVLDKMYALLGSEKRWY